MTIQGDYLEFESDELNQHECMASLTEVLKHMHSNNITPKIEEVRDHFPLWCSLREGLLVKTKTLKSVC